MGNSLIEQLKKTGLVDKTRAQKVAHGKYKNKKQKSKKGSADQIGETKLQAQKAHAEKVYRDRQINQQQNEALEHKAIAAQIRQLIETNRVEDYHGDIVYNFTDDNVVKQINISEQVYKHLMSGRLAIAKQGEDYELVPMPVAEKIKQRDAQRIILSEHSTEPERDDGDPYVDYKIPDDLMW